MTNQTLVGGDGVSLANKIVKPIHDHIIIINPALGQTSDIGYGISCRVQWMAAG